MWRYLSILLAALTLSACGFHLRGGGGSLPALMRKVYITGIPAQDPLRVSLKEALIRDGATVVPNADKQAVVLQISSEETMRNLSLSRSGLSSEQDIGLKITYEIKTAQGEVIEPSRKLKFNKEQYNDQFLIIGREEERRKIRDEMADEAADTLVRRMAFLLKDKVLETPAEQPAATPEKSEPSPQSESTPSAGDAGQPQPGAERGAATTQDGNKAAEPAPAQRDSSATPSGNQAAP